MPSLVLPPPLLPPPPLGPMPAAVAPAPDVPVVPEADPATLLLAGCLALALFAARRR